MDKADSIRTYMLVRGMFACFLVLMVFLILLTTAFPIGLWIVAGLAVLLFVIVHIHARTTTYMCRTCNAHFKITTWTDLSSPHWVTQKLLRCPVCGEVAWNRSTSEPEA